MSNEVPIYAHAVPVSSSSSGYMWPWIIVIIILIIVIIILAIWLAVRYNQTSSGGGCRLTGIQGGSILSSSTAISGSWTAIPNEDDKVTLYVSTSPLAFNTDGTAISPTVKPVSTTGSNNSLTVTPLTNNTMYYAALVATGSDTNHYAIYGQKIVYTQETVDLTGNFNILNLNTTGGVTSDAGYKESSPFGVFSYEKTNSYIINQSEGQEGKVLCRNTGATDTSVAFVEADEATPALCQWSYNDTPPTGVDGKNLWCLKASQSTSTTNVNSQTLCLARNGGVLNVVTPSAATVWYNPLIK